MKKRELPPYLPADWPDYADIPTLKQWERAQAEDRAVAAALAAAKRSGPPSPMSTPESISHAETLRAEWAPRLAAQKAELERLGAINEAGQLQSKYFSLDPSALGQVLEVMEKIPMLSVHWWLTSQSEVLQESPLEALRRGRLAEVPMMAHGFADR